MTELRDLLSTLNPWWAERPFETGKPRPLYFEKIRRYLSTGEILVLSGVRRSGKTTLLYQIIHELITEQNVPPRNILFVNCDEQEISGLHHPITTVVETYRKEVHPRGTIYLVFDEIQNVHDWERAVKSLYDRKNYRIIISGSSSYRLDSQLSELLSGRYLTVPVFPLDFFEYLSFHGIAVSDDPVSLAADKYEILSRLKQYMVEGGFPLVVLEENDATKRDHLQAYYDSIVYRDIIRVNVIRNQKALADLLHYLFTNIASPFSYRRLKEMLGVDSTTVKEYIHYAHIARILFEVSHFAYSLPAQKRPNRKIYCIDNGLRNAVSFRFSRDEGRLAENLVFIDLIRNGKSPYYWKKKYEVDFVIKNQDTTLSAINICYSDTIPPREKTGLFEFSEEFRGAVKELIILTMDTEKEENGISFIPLWKWLLIRK